jgi:hypothetical protein
MVRLSAERLTRAQASVRNTRAGQLRDARPLALDLTDVPKFSVAPETNVPGKSSHPAASRTPLREGLPMLGGIAFLGLSLYLFGIDTGGVVYFAGIASAFVLAVVLAVVRVTMKARAEVTRQRAEDQ